MKKSIVHTCFQQHLREQKPKCRCRKRITLLEATKEVEKGFAEWLVISEHKHIVKELCSLCNNDSILKKSCSNCNKTGEIEKSYPIKIVSTDIVLVSTGCQDGDEILYRSVKAKQTPRVATIEKSHIEKAFVEGIEEERLRIEAYGMLTLLSRIEMGIKLEPPDDAATSTGRKHDWGRPIFAKTPDQRTGKK